MSFSKKNFEEIESKIIATLDGKRVIDVPYYRYLYPPSNELACLKMFETFYNILNKKGYSAEIIYLSEIIIESLNNLGFLSKTHIEVEEQNFEDIKTNLEEVLVDEVVNLLKDKLKDKDITHCVIMLRTGSMFPFIHVSELLSKIEGYIKCTIIMAYPGFKEGEMLGCRGDKIYYRGEIIGDD